MTELDFESKKLKEVQQQYLELIKDCQKRIDIILKDYQDDPITQAALLEQFHIRLEQLKRTIQSPFFGRIDFLPDEDLKNTICYIGKVGVMDHQGNPITVDWRAPISSLYYDSNIGRAQYLAPKGMITGDLKLKRQFDIQEGEIKSFQDVDTVSNDELLKPYLSTSADNRLKNIVATIQSEQNAIIRKGLYTNNIIQGTAGSGKTTVALHRASYLIYNEQKNFRENQFIVIGPNAYFMDYISSVLPDLDVHSVTETTFLNIVNDYLGEKIKIIDQNARLERILNGEKIDPYIAFKSSLKYKEVLDLFVSHIEDSVIHGPITLRNVVLISEEEIRKFLGNHSVGILEKIKDFKKFAKQKIKENLDDFKHTYWLQYRDEFLGLAKDHPRRKEIIDDTSSFDQEITKNIDQILKEYFKNFNLKPLTLYRLFVENIDQYVDGDFEKLKRDTLKAIQTKTLGYEDLPALVYLNLLFNGYKGYDQYIHVIVDEAQDYGLFHFEVLKELFKNSTFSIFGDLAQSIYAYQSIHDWESVIHEVFNEKMELLKLEKSYRTTVEIMDAANLVSRCFGSTDAKAVLRHGNSVEVYQMDAHNTSDYVIKRIQDFLEQGFKSIAIICKDEEEVSMLSKMFQKNHIKHSTINSKNTKYDGGICLVSSYLAKGLEFDAVIIYDVDQYDANSELDMKLLYVAMTRALHQLDVTYQKELIYPLASLYKSSEVLQRKKN